jgi:PAS domain S-box-containing protein
MPEETAPGDHGGLMGSLVDLTAVLANVGDGVRVQDLTGRLVYANVGAARTLGFSSPADLLAASLSELDGRYALFDENGRPIAIERLPGRRALAGEMEPEITIRFRILATGEERWATVRASPIRDEAGQVRFAVNIWQDVTAHKQAGQRFLAEVGEVLASSLDVERTLQRVAGLTVPTVADWCSIHLLRDDGTIEPVAISHVDPTRTEWVWELQRRFPVAPDAPTGVARVIRTAQPEFVPAITDAAMAAAEPDPERLALVRRLRLSSSIIVPLAARDRMIGTISLYWAESRRRYDEADLALATELARRAALAVDNARLAVEARAAEARFRAIFAGAAEGILLIADDGRILDANVAATRLLGYDLDELRAIPSADALLVEPSRAADQPRPRGERSWCREIVVRRKDGRTVPVETHVARLELAEGPVLLALWHNIAERKAAERFEHQFLEELAHDLKNPLASARIQAQLLRRRMKSGRVDAVAIDRAAASVEADTSRIARRLDELAALARSRLGKEQ